MTRVPRQGHACCTACLTELRARASKAKEVAKCPKCQGEDVVKSGQLVCNFSVKAQMAQAQLRCLECHRVVLGASWRQHCAQRCRMASVVCPKACGWSGPLALVGGHLQTACRMVAGPCPHGCGAYVRPAMASLHAEACAAARDTRQEV